MGSSWCSSLTIRDRATKVRRTATFSQDRKVRSAAKKVLGCKGKTKGGKGVYKGRNGVQGQDRGRQRCVRRQEWAARARQREAKVCKQESDWNGDECTRVLRLTIVVDVYVKGFLWFICRSPRAGAAASCTAPAPVCINWGWLCTSKGSCGSCVGHHVQVLVIKHRSYPKIWRPAGSLACVCECVPPTFCL